MTTKKKAQGGSKGKAAGRDTKRLEARAEAIIDNTRDYDADTRRAVHVELRNLKFYQSGGTPGIETPEQAKKKAREYAAGLAELCRRAESGEIILDLTDVAEETAREARIIFDLIERPNACPQFIYEALMVALDEAARISGIEVWKYTDEEAPLETGGYSLRAIIALLARFPAEAIPLEPKHDLAACIASVLKHPDTPSVIYNGLSEGVTELGVDADSAAYVRLALDCAEKRGSKEGGGR
jgi:hypothetical protein